MSKPISQYGVASSALNFGATGSLGLNPACHELFAPIKVSLSQLTTIRWSLLEEVAQLKQTGYDAIGIWRPKLLELGEADAGDLLKRSCLNVASISFAGGFTGNCGFSYLEAIADGRQAIAQARALGAANVIVVGGTRNGHTLRHSERLVVDGLREIVEDAAAARVRLCVLPMKRAFNKRWTFLNSLDQTLDLIHRVNHPQVKLAFDTFHLWEEPRLLERIPEITPLTSIVQLSDSALLQSATDGQLLPGNGIIPLSGIVQAFQKAGYTGYFDVQVWSSMVWRGNYAHQIEQTHAAVKAMSLNTAATI